MNTVDSFEPLFFNICLSIRNKLTIHTIFVDFVLIWLCMSCTQYTISYAGDVSGTPYGDAAFQHVTTA